MTDERDLDVGTFRPPMSDALRAFLAQGWAERTPRELRPLALAAPAAGHRARLSERFPHERLVVPAGTLAVRSNDCDYPFRAHSDYVWATGHQEPDSVLVLEPTGSGHDAVLFARGASGLDDPVAALDGRSGELYVGRRLSLAETASAYGFEVRALSELEDRLEDRPARVVRGVDDRVDSLVSPTDPYLDGELAAVLSELRAVKDDWEIEQLRHAVDATARGFEDVVRSLPQARKTSERWLEATFFRRARVEGNDVGYNSIVASGDHATALHWIRNDGPVEAGDLLLMDAGVETTTLYTADITRTMPVDGRFTQPQRQVYQLVLDAQEAALATVRPGTTVKDFHDAALRTLAEGLSDWGLLPVSADEAMSPGSGVHRRYTVHGIGHMLGLDVHDCARARARHYFEGVLQEGHVFTVEPGLYFQRDDLTVPEELRGIGVRIEDDFVVTADGYDLLSNGLPRAPDDVEAWMDRMWDPTTG